MVMMGLEFMGDIPFATSTSTAWSATAGRMSKSLGTGIDPLELIDEYGADATRFALAIETYIGRDVRLGEPRIQEAKKFINKVWNAARFTLANQQDAGAAPEFSPADLWTRSRLQAAIAAARDHVEHFRFHEMADSIYHFIWDELLRLVHRVGPSPRSMRPTRPAAGPRRSRTLRETLDAAIRLLHPVMPFFTEERTQALGDDRPSVMVSAYPAADPAGIDAAAEARLTQVQEVVVAIRNIRSENLVPPAPRPASLIPGAGDLGRVAGRVEALPYQPAAGADRRV